MRISATGTVRSSPEADRRTASWGASSTSPLMERRARSPDRFHSSSDPRIMMKLMAAAARDLALEERGHDGQAHPARRH